MKLVRYETVATGPAIGVLTADGVLPSAATDMAAVIAGGGRPAPSGPAVRDYRLLAPIPRPGKIFGSGINYLSHKTENPDAVMPEEPGFFAKFPSSVCGPGDPILLPAPDSTVDYEVELAVVIGRPGRDLTPESAMAHVFGYTVINDVSDRGVQFRPNQMVLGKGFDSFCPMGPALVTADELPDLNELRVRSHVNGELRQDAPVSDMLFTIPELIAHASRNITLEPGDLITTGTPAGCGTFLSPPLWLRPGDLVTVAVTGIGELANPVVAGWETGA
ncbi:MAG TPA: fumarylacetoacetate hydrolase family protein [Trebonia sp.]|jgi:2-keto-4-pentenoate hydratase/2-oxohepta-3-ene-1,7-dioic acid hydratase in catechol pathway|nr:fumarylacetoacetate hydrolase family protein [Trebonia sp.]